MAEWKYLWLRTYWAETERTADYVQWVSYEHRWKPDGEQEEIFPSDDGLNNLGKEGWELVTAVPSQVSLVTSVSPQRGDGYSNFTVYALIFKRPVQAS